MFNAVFEIFLDVFCWIFSAIMVFSAFMIAFWGFSCVMAILGFKWFEPIAASLAPDNGEDDDSCGGYIM